MNVYKVTVEYKGRSEWDEIQDWLWVRDESYMYHTVQQDFTHNEVQRTVYNFGAKGDAIMFALKWGGEVTVVDMW